MKFKLKSYGYLKIQLLLVVMLCGMIVFNQEINVKASEEISLKIISSPGEIEGLIAKDEGLMIQNTAVEVEKGYYSYYSFTIDERGWLITERYATNKKKAWWGNNVNIYTNASLTKQISDTYNNWNDGGDRYAYYLEPGTYYVEAYYKNCTQTIYGYFLPSSAVLSANVTPNSNGTSATITCNSTIGATSYYDWVNDISSMDKITNNKFYSNSSVNGIINVTENGTYSIRVKSSLAEWVNYPIDVQVTVSGITLPELTTAVEKDIPQTTTVANDIPQITTVANDISQTTISKDNQNIKVGRVVLNTPKNKKGKKVKITWKKVGGSNGYQIQYALNKKFTKSLKKTTVKASALAKTIKNFKKKKTYYFRVRAYKKSSNGNIYGEWSKVKKVKIKK